MAVIHLPTSEVHVGAKGGTTGCGFDTTVHPENWANTSAAIT